MFELARFRRLIAAQWAENGRAYAWFLGIGVILHFVLVLLLLSTSRGYASLTLDGQRMIYFTGLFLTGTIFAARYFQAFARTESALLLVMRPAAVFEKWLLALLAVLVVYPLGYTVAFQLCNLPAALLAGNAALADAMQQLAEGKIERVADHFDPQNYRIFLPWDVFGDAWRLVLIWLAGLQAFAMLGSLWFRTMPFIKTVVAGFIILLVVMLLEAVAGTSTGSAFKFWDDTASWTDWRQFHYALVWFGVPGLLWLGCYFALKERQIA